MPKTLEELAKQVEQGQSGLQSLDDLVALFAEEPIPAQTPTPEPPVVAAPAPSTAQAPNPQVTPPVNSGQGEPNEDILKRVPDKFRDKDLPSSLEKTVNSYLALEQESTRTKEELLRLRELVENLSRPVPASNQLMQPNAQVATPQEGADDFADIDDVSVLERPKELILRMVDKRAAQIAAAAVGQYHQMQVDQLRRSQIIEQFKAAHSDFDTYVDDMRAVIQARPDLNQRTDSLPVIFDMAKERYRKRIETQRTQLGIVDHTPQQLFTEEMKQSLLVEATEKAKREILEEVRKRRAASGTLPGSTPNTMQSIVEEKPKDKPMTYEEKVFNDMMTSGPNKPGWEK